MDWWAWVIAGGILLGAELAFVDAQFYLVFIGGAAITTGLLGWVLPDWFAAWLQWALFAVLALGSVAGFRGRIYQRLRGHPPAVATGQAGEEITVPVPLAPGESCQVELRGAYWTARNDGNAPIPAQGRARVVSVHGLTLLVRTAA
jgi:membrane protein implicated in regulation of membrane protease activity